MRKGRPWCCLLLALGCAPDQFVSMGSDGDHQGGGFGGTSGEVSSQETGGTGGARNSGTEAAAGSSGNAQTSTNALGLGGATGHAATITAGAAYRPHWKI